mmetsp:Transcript_25616/g.82959  ORF Transcript_25616/g.82959 Transcript_25616/m.82959 type:complete len:705 (-) Transcript_25616:209-2323(-)
MLARGQSLRRLLLRRDVLAASSLAHSDNGSGDEDRGADNNVFPLPAGARRRPGGERGPLLLPTKATSDVVDDAICVLDVMAARGLRAAHELDEAESVLNALRLLTEKRVGSALVTRRRRVAGVFTARDVLRWLHERTDDDPVSALAALDSPVGRISTAADKVAWCAPRDALTRVRVVMRALGVRNLPVVCTATGSVLGLLTANDVADYSLEQSSDATDLGGKDSFLRATNGRSGLPSAAAVVDSETRKSLFAAVRHNEQSENEDTTMLLKDDLAFLSKKKQRQQQQEQTIPREELLFYEKKKKNHQRVFFSPLVSHHPSSRHRRLEFRVGARCLPNPLKFPDGTLANSRRDKVEAEALATDPELSEDAFFVTESRSGAQYVGVFDGVGSWRKLGVDPRRYPRALRDAVVDAVEQNTFQRPHDLLSAAWRRVTKDKVPGSTTACVLTLDEEVNALSYVNLGDAGVVVFRDVDASNAGTANAAVGRVGRKQTHGGGGFSGSSRRALEATTSGAKNNTPSPTNPTNPNPKKRRQVVLVAPQQLREFNLPYQLGWTNAYEAEKEQSLGARGDIDEKKDDPGAVLTFETPAHANVASFPVQPGDVVVVASDGLFDNVFLDHVTDLVADWEADEENHHGDLTALADLLCHTARDLSLHDDTDSPFALLAKENDILWGGGMPDDVTVLALRVDAAPPSSPPSSAKGGTTSR